MKKGSNSFAAIILVVTLVLFLGEFLVTEAVTCSVVELSPCAGAISSPQPPSSACCAKLKEQKPCLCGYLKNPNLRPYVNSPNAKRVAKSCGVPTPSC
ncbi:non-specific lipid-transfer protein 2-like [Nicotiana sylvestris]|uniref:Non-specific lipid-transfer protein 2-like n=1 Tax=Nicotiana sylvestris TaxID=4096 RepID=A0A1U7WSP0_NICSY|nr:PREDICTED: non-specific lipid-transfer protein 2-like [Nicotiana sylvestris]